MDNSGDPYLVFKVFVPIVSFGLLSVCCAGFCRIFQRVREERMPAQVRSMDQPSVYVIPIPMSEDDLHRPPRYSTVQFSEPPPAYEELYLKPETGPVEPPPAYTESVSSSPSHS